MNDYWIWKWQASANGLPDTGRPLRWPITAIGAPVYGIVGNYLALAAPQASTFIASKAFPQSDWAYYRNNMEARFQVFNISPSLSPNSSDNTGPVIVLDDGVKRITVGLVVASRQDIRVDYLGVLGGLNPYDISSWYWRREIDLDGRWHTVQIRSYPGSWVQIYLNGLLWLEMPYANLPASTAREVAWGYDIGRSGVEMLWDYVQFYHDAVGRIQPAWSVYDAALKTYPVDTYVASAISRPPFTLSAGLVPLSQVRSFLEPVLTNAGWTVLLSGPTGSPVTNGPFVVYQPPAASFWLYLWCEPGVLNALVFDAPYGNIADLFTFPPPVPVTTHPPVSCRMNEFLQPFVTATDTSFHFFAYGESPATEFGGYLEVDLGRTIYPTVTDPAPAMITGGTESAWVAFHRGPTGVWSELQPSWILDPGNIGNGDASWRYLGLLHTQPSELTFVTLADLFDEILENNFLPVGDEVIVQTDDPRRTITRYQLYQYHWGEAASIPGVPETRFFPRSSLLTSEGLMGSVIRSSNLNFFIRPPMGPESGMTFPLSHFVGGLFDRDLIIDG